MFQQRSSSSPYSPERVANARRVWEPIYRRALTDAEIDEIIFNTSGLLRALFGLRQPQVSSTPMKPSDPISSD